jgi:hypothetical protein
MNYNRVTIAENKTPLLVICDDVAGNFLQVPETFVDMFGPDVQRASLEVCRGVLSVYPLTDEADCAFACGDFDFRKEAEVMKADEQSVLHEVVDFVTDEALNTEAVWALTDALLASGEDVHLAIKHRAQA